MKFNIFKKETFKNKPFEFPCILRTSSLSFAVIHQYFQFIVDLTSFSSFHKRCNYLSTNNFTQATPAGMHANLISRKEEGARKKNQKEQENRDDIKEEGIKKCLFTFLSCCRC